jgi:hypothetical protein
MPRGQSTWIAARSLLAGANYLLGLSLKARLPAAAWYCIVKVYCFFALWGEKTIHKELKITGRRKSYL